MVKNNTLILLGGAGLAAYLLFKDKGILEYSGYGGYGGISGMGGMVTTRPPTGTLNSMYKDNRVITPAMRTSSGGYSSSATKAPIQNIAASLPKVGSAASIASIPAVKSLPSFYSPAGQIATKIMTGTLSVPKATTTPMTTAPKTRWYNTPGSAVIKSAVSYIKKIF